MKPLDSLCIGFAIALIGAGCTTTQQEHVVTEAKSHLKPVNCRRIAVIATSTVPELTFHTPIGRRDRTSQAMKTGFTLGTDDPKTVEALLPIPVLGLAIPTASSVLSGANAILRAPSDRAVERGQESIKRTVYTRHLQDFLRMEIVDQQTARGDNRFVYINKPFPAGEEEQFQRMASMMCATLAWVPEDQTVATFLKKQGMDGMLLIEIHRASLDGNGEINPSMALRISGEATLVDLQTGEILRQTPFSYSGCRWKFTTWGRDHGKLFEAEWRKAQHDVGAKVLAGLLPEQYVARPEQIRHRPSLAFGR
jgi:hypothetical protein